MSGLPLKYIYKGKQMTEATEHMKIYYSTILLTDKCYATLHGGQDGDDVKVGRLLVQTPSQMIKKSTKCR